jgi:hypothetical protein
MIFFSVGVMYSGEYEKKSGIYMFWNIKLAVSVVLRNGNLMLLCLTYVTDWIKFVVIHVIEAILKKSTRDNDI